MTPAPSARVPAVRAHRDRRNPSCFPQNRRGSVTQVFAARQTSARLIDRSAVGIVLPRVDVPRLRYFAGGSPMPRPSIAEKRSTFRALHQQGCFVIPNPWNVGTTRYLQSLGFKALATTSSGHAHSQGLSDGDATRDIVLAHCREIADAADVPVNSDYENGYADDLGALADNVRACVETGVAGLSIEDFTGNDADPIYAFDVAVKRVRAARGAIGNSGVVLTGRAEGF